jgi:hypothetical protein
MRLLTYGPLTVDSVAWAGACFLRVASPACSVNHGRFTKIFENFSALLMQISSIQVPSIKFKQIITFFKTDAGRRGNRLRVMY